ncbi:hypothetical protein F4808DRAFT_465176 [Astrocystis sublimbata]|nr:hypothetical protein F4808DRAFT_465176 [Astrocystis sublimbata]
MAGVVQIQRDWVMTILAAIAVVFRFYLRQTFADGIAAQDWFMLGALIFQLAYQSGFTLMCLLGSGQSTSRLTVPQLTVLTKWSWIFGTFAHPASLLARISIAILLVRIFSTKPWFKRYVISFTVLQVAVGITLVVIELAQAQPYQALWDPLIPGAKLWNPDIYRWVADVLQFLYAVGDLTLVMFPVVMLWKLNMSTRRKLTLGALIALSLITMAAASSKVVIGTLFIIDATVALDGSRGQHIINFTTSLEQSLVITMGCIPVLHSVSKVRLPSVKNIGHSLIQREHRAADKAGTRAPVKANGLPVKAPKPTSICQNCRKEIVNTNKVQLETHAGTHDAKLWPKEKCWPNDFP